VVSALDLVVRRATPLSPLPSSRSTAGAIRCIPLTLHGWRARRSATRCDPGDHGALDATFFDREAASSHYVNRSDRHIRTLKTTALVDTESCAVLDLHCSAHWPHDTQVGRRVALRKTDEIESLAEDKGYDDQSLRDALRSKGVRPVIRH